MVHGRVDRSQMCIAQRIPKKWKRWQPNNKQKISPCRKQSFRCNWEWKWKKMKQKWHKYFFFSKWENLKCVKISIRGGILLLLRSTYVPILELLVVVSFVRIGFPTVETEVLISWSIRVRLFSFHFVMLTTNVGLSLPKQDYRIVVFRWLFTMVKSLLFVFRLRANWVW